MAKKRKNSNYVTEKRAQAQAERERAKRSAKNKKIIKTVGLSLAIVGVAVLLVVSLGFAFGWWDDNPNKNLEVTHHASITIKDYGTVHVELYGKDAPETVENFVNLAESGFYNGLTFHRIMEGFMAQGGCPNGNGTGDSGLDIKGEFAANGVDNPTKHVRGTISMARGDDPNSGSCQFFIVHETSADNTKALDGNYAAFGMVTDGMDIIDAICENAKPTDNNGTIRASEQPVIESITIHASH